MYSSKKPRRSEAALIVSTLWVPVGLKNIGDRILLVIVIFLALSLNSSLTLTLASGSSSMVDKEDLFKGEGENQPIIINSDHLEGDNSKNSVVFSGNAISVEQFNSKPVIITIPSKVFDPIKKDEKRKGNITKKKITTEKYSSNILRIKEMETGGVNVEDAEIIVSCGRGLKNKDDIKLIEDLASALKGKTVGCSRPIAADLKWLPEDHWIGLSGHKVKPKLYIAAGISGQIQHIAGMRDSGIIVAINKDPEALIFKSADYGIIGDLYEVLPKLTNAVKEKMG